MPEFLRKRNRLPPSAYLGRQFYFTTLCTEQRMPHFSNVELVKRLVEELREACRVHGINVYAYCFMPNHLHLALVGMERSASLRAMIRSFKGRSAVRARQAGVATLWQKGYYDHVLRSGKALDPIAWYIWNNPVRAGLVKEWDAWPSSGSFMFRWKRMRPPSESFTPPWKLAG